jgi:hypothetical protein
MKGCHPFDLSDRPNRLLKNQVWDVIGHDAGGGSGVAVV